MNKIKQLRTAARMTVKDLSEKANVAVGYISTLENDETDTTNPTKDVMGRIALALDRSVPEVFYPEKE